MLSATADVVVRAVDGSELLGRLDRPSPPDATAPIGVLLTHGVATDHQGSVVGWLGERLARRGWPALTLDRRDRPGAALVTTVEDGLDDLAVGIDRLIGEGVDQVVLVGHSKGTALAAAYAARRADERVAALVLLAPVHDQYLVARDVLLVDRYEPTLTDATARVAAGDGAPYEIGGEGSGMVATAEAFVSNFGPDTAAAPIRVMAQLSVPVLAVRVDGDELTPAAYQAAVVVAGERAGLDITAVTLAGVPGGSADAHRFVGRHVELADVIAAWLAAHTATRS